MAFVFNMATGKVAAVIKEHEGILKKITVFYYK
jgi:hypothetical protein